MPTGPVCAAAAVPTAVAETEPALGVCSHVASGVGRTGVAPLLGVAVTSSSSVCTPPGVVTGLESFTGGTGVGEVFDGVGSGETTGSELGSVTVGSGVAVGFSEAPGAGTVVGTTVLGGFTLPGLLGGTGADDVGVGTTVGEAAVVNGGNPGPELGLASTDGVHTGVGCTTGACSSRVPIRIAAAADGRCESLTVLAVVEAGFGRMRLMPCNTPTDQAGWVSVGINATAAIPPDNVTTSAPATAAARWILTERGLGRG